MLSSFRADAGIESDLKRMVGYTIVYVGHVQNRVERNYSEKLIQLDNGWVFRIDCMISLPLAYTDVIVFGKRYPEELLKRFPNLTTQKQFQFKLFIEREICDASITN